MRIVTLGQFKKIDIACKFPKSARPVKTTNAPSLDSFVTPYVFAQVEPSTAVLCACLVTYRPLFRDLNLSFLKSLMQSIRLGSSKNNTSLDSDSSASNTDNPWEGLSEKGEVWDRSYERLNKKAANGTIHIVNLGTMPSRFLDHRTSRNGELYTVPNSRIHDSTV